MHKVGEARQPITRRSVRRDVVEFDVEAVVVLGIEIDVEKLAAHLLEPAAVIAELPVRELRSLGVFARGELWIPFGTPPRDHAVEESRRGVPLDYRCSPDAIRCASLRVKPAAMSR